MSDGVLVAIIAGVPGTIGALLGWANRGSIGVIHQLADGNLTAMREQRKEDLARIESLEGLVRGLTGREAPKAPL